MQRTSQIKCDSSIEKSFDKIDLSSKNNTIESKKNSKFKKKVPLENDSCIFGSSQESVDQQETFNIIENLRKIERTDSPKNKNLKAKNSICKPCKGEKYKSAGSQLSKIYPNEAISPQLYKSSSMGRYSTNMYQPSVNSKTFKDFFCVKMVKAHQSTEKIKFVNIKKSVALDNQEEWQKKFWTNYNCNMKKELKKLNSSKTRQSSQNIDHSSKRESKPCLIYVNKSRFSHKISNINTKESSHNIKSRNNIELNNARTLFCNKNTINKNFNACT